jgi:hypothetical protein
MILKIAILPARQVLQSVLDGRGEVRVLSVISPRSIGHGLK